MQRLSGFLLILVGVTLAGYSYIPPPPGGAATFTSVRHFSATDDLRTEDGNRVFSPVSPAFREHEPIVESSTQSESGKAARPWSAVVSLEPAPNTLKSWRPADPETRMEITRDLQRELKRVGCYSGEINGNWSARSRAAMTDFMNRVNATLPVDEPDYILLTLVQGQRGIACSAGCPSGEIMINTRCTPHAVVAQASRMAKRQNVESSGSPRKVRDAADTPEPRVAQIATPSATRADPPMATAALPNAKPIAIASADPEKLPWLGDTIADPPMKAAEPLPGRMAIGGPVGPALEQIAPFDGKRVQWEPIPVGEKPLDQSVTRAKLRLIASLAHDDDSVPASASPHSDTMLSAVTPRRSHKKSFAKSKSGRAFRHDPPTVSARPYYAQNISRHRRGDPYPGSMRYNLMLSLGGVY